MGVSERSAYLHESVNNNPEQQQHGVFFNTPILACHYYCYSLSFDFCLTMAVEITVVVTCESGRVENSIIRCLQEALFSFCLCYDGVSFPDVVSVTLEIGKNTGSNPMAWGWNRCFCHFQRYVAICELNPSPLGWWLPSLYGVS